MEITAPDQDQYWLQISAHTSASKNGSHTRAPWSVQLQVAALLDNCTIDGSVASFDGRTPTTWAISLITADGRLIRVTMQFDAEQYDSEQDLHSSNPLEPLVKESWIRRLSDVESIGIGRSRLRTGTFGRVQQNVLDLADVTLTFRGGAVVDLGIDQLGMTQYDDRGRSDTFVEALRRRIQL